MRSQRIAWMGGEPLTVDPYPGPADLGHRVWEYVHRGCAEHYSRAPGRAYSTELAIAGIRFGRPVNEGS